MEQPPKDESRWRIKREISIADILSFVSAGVAVIYAYSTLDKRMSLLEERQAEYQRVVKKQEEEALRLQTRIDMRLDKLDEKMDRLLTQRPR